MPAYITAYEIESTNKLEKAESQKTAIKIKVCHCASRTTRNFVTSTTLFTVLRAPSPPLSPRLCHGRPQLKKPFEHYKLNNKDPRKLTDEQMKESFLMLSASEKQDNLAEVLAENQKVPYCTHLLCAPTTHTLATSF